MNYNRNKILKIGDRGEDNNTFKKVELSARIETHPPNECFWIAMDVETDEFLIIREEDFIPEEKR